MGRHTFNQFSSGRKDVYKSWKQLPVDNRLKASIFRTNPGNSMKHPINKFKGDDHKLPGSHFLGYCYLCHFKGKAQRWPNTMTFWCPRSAPIHWEKIKCLQHLLFNDFLLISDVEIQGFLNTPWFAFFTGKNILKRADLWQNSRWVVLIHDFFVMIFNNGAVSPTCLPLWHFSF